MLIGNDLDQGLALVTVSILVMFAFPLVMARWENSLTKPPRTRVGRGPTAHVSPHVTAGHQPRADDADATTISVTTPTATRPAP
ncbi:hypothetical protein GCM10027596_36140 [Nocardioides korecus]